MNALPIVKVTQLEAHNGWLITCSKCPIHKVRASRVAADLVATEHHKACGGGR